MSISRQVLSSPFDIPTKPRANTATTTTTTRSTHRKNAKNRNNGSTNNIMSDSRVVRRSLFNPPVGKPAEGEGIKGGILDDEKRSRCVVFDSRLFRQSNVFASPLVTVIDVANENDKPKSPTKRIKPPVVAKVHRNIHVQTDDDVSTTDLQDRTYSESGSQTDIRCSFDDVEEEIDMGESSSAEEEITSQQFQDGVTPVSRTTNAEQMQGRTITESHEVDKRLVKTVSDPSVEINDDDAENIPPSELALMDPT